MQNGNQNIESGNSTNPAVPAESSIKKAATRVGTFFWENKGPILFNLSALPAPIMLAVWAQNALPFFGLLGLEYMLFCVPGCCNFTFREQSLQQGSNQVQPADHVSIDVSSANQGSEPEQPNVSERTSLLPSTPKP